MCLSITFTVRFVRLAHFTDGCFYVVILWSYAFFTYLNIFGMMEYIEVMDPLFSAWKHLFLRCGLSTLVSSVANTFLTVFSQLLVPCTMTVCYMFYSDCFEWLVCAVHPTNDIIRICHEDFSDWTLGPGIYQ